MASNQRKEQIRVEWSTNYTQAIQQIEQVKKSVSDNATEMENLNRIQKQLEDNFKGFETTLEFVAKQTADNEYANQKLTEAIEKLEKQIGEVDTKLNALGQSLNDVAKANDKVADSVDDVAKANDKASKSIDKSASSIDKASKKSKDLSDNQKDLSKSTQLTNDATATSSVLFQRLDEVSFGVASNLRDLIGVQGGLGTALKSTSKDYATLNVAQKATVIGTNAVKIGFKALMAATGIGLLVVAVGQIAENWDDIVDGVKGFISETYKANDAIIKNNREQVDKLKNIDNQTERLKQQGFTDEQINKKKLDAYQEILKKEKETLKAIKEKDLQNTKWTTNVKVKFLEAVGWVTKSLGTLMKAITTPAEVFLGMLEKGINSLLNSSVGKFLGLSGTVDLTFAHDGIDKVINEVDSYVKKKTTEWRNADYEESQEYKEQAKAIDDMEEKIAGQQNRIKDGSRAKSSSTKSNDDDIKKAQEALKAWQEVMRNLENDTAILNSKDVFEKRLNELAKSESDFIKERQTKYEELEKTYAKGSAEYLKSKQTIDDFYDGSIKKITEEKTAIENNTKAFEELSKKLKDGTMDAEAMKKEIDSFLEGVENSDMKEEWAKLLGLSEIENAIALIGELKDEIKSYEIDTTKSFKENKENLKNAFEANIALIEKNRKAELEQLGDKEKFAKEREKIEKKYDKQILSNKEDYAQAEDDINSIQKEQIVELANASLDAMSMLNGAMGDNWELEKGFAVGKSIINTYEGVTANLKMAQPYGGIMAGITLASGLASVMQILKTEPNASAGASMPNVANLEGAKNQPNVSFQQSGESQLAQTINQQNQDPIKAYVVAKDVTSQQEKDSIKKNNSSL